MIENEREESRQRVKSVEVTVKQMEQAFVDGERKRQELQHVMDSMFSRSAYTQLYRNHEKKKILLARSEAQLRFKVMTQGSNLAESKVDGSLLVSLDAKSDKIKKVAAAFSLPGKRNVDASSQPANTVEVLDGSFFNGLGEGRDLPRYLRSSLPVRHQILQLQGTRVLVKQFWSQVESTSSASSVSSGSGIHEHLNAFFVKKNDSLSVAYSLIKASQQFAGADVLIELFWKTWCGEFRCVFCCCHDDVI